MSQTSSFKGKWGTAVRSLYKVESSQFIQGNAMRADDLRIRAMNYGQHWRTEGIQSIDYEVRLPLSYVYDFLNSELPEYIMEAKTDRDEEDELDGLLEAFGWSDDAANLLMNGSKRLVDLLLDFYAFEMLLHWYSDGQAPDGGGVINAHDQFKIENDHLIIKGKCRKSDRPVRYQDV
ncbi:hypothetical protein BFP97_03545 [Roseivirga sp. 4D4]|uniref:hypothetical protein n=1 Tax=Roseivirga sp. 4D4 TaxID=1889784 RepID=UPI0008539BD5|nr:hypothetical protein [Roseivirga sp. 4D4]OEK00634.1 hypothetical protein BFP97_03545 [Roseivirga sp. 4D4]